jgi:hypothetical protein
MNILNLSREQKQKLLAFLAFTKKRSGKFFAVFITIIIMHMRVFFSFFDRLKICEMPSGKDSRNLLDKKSKIFALLFSQLGINR